MRDNFCVDEGQVIVPILLVREQNFESFIQSQSEEMRQWVLACGFSAAADSFCLIPDNQGNLSMVIAGVGSQITLWSAAFLANALPSGHYRFDAQFTSEAMVERIYTMLAFGWGLAGYRFDKFKKSDNEKKVMLVIPRAVDIHSLRAIIDATYYIRDLINLPANHMGPSHLADAARTLAREFEASCEVIVGSDLLVQGYPAIHAVGRASADAPCLIDLRWGQEDAPKVTLVGKGVCFDTGGLDLKSADNMKLMKKDMGGAAHVLGLAKLIMQAQLPVRLRVLVPAVENSVSSNAFRPLDVISTRKGITVEIGNTDAEGRVILADALYEAVTEKPDLLIDCATLTGAARVALGTDIPAFFTDDEMLANDIYQLSVQQQDPLWRLPLYAGYEDQIKGSVAHLNNAPSSPYGGAITAALFLKRFCEGQMAWVHIDMMAWNTRSRAGRPEGGEAMGLRTLFALIQQKFIS